MDFINKFKGIKIPAAAKIFALMLLAFGFYSMALYFKVLLNTEGIKATVEKMAAQSGGNPVVITDAQIQTLKNTMIFQLVLTGISLIGLAIIFFERSWGYLVFALASGLLGLFALIKGDLVGIMSGLLPVLVMGVILNKGIGQSPKPTVSQ